MADEHLPISAAYDIPNFRLPRNPDPKTLDIDERIDQDLDNLETAETAIIKAGTRVTPDQLDAAKKLIAPRINNLENLLTVKSSELTTAMEKTDPPTPDADLAEMKSDLQEDRARLDRIKATLFGATSSGYKSFRPPLVQMPNGGGTPISGTQNMRLAPNGELMRPTVGGLVQPPPPAPASIAQPTAPAAATTVGAVVSPAVSALGQPSATKIDLSNVGWMKTLEAGGELNGPPAVAAGQARNMRLYDHNANTDAVLSIQAGGEASGDFQKSPSGAGRNQYRDGKMGYATLDLIMGKEAEARAQLVDAKAKTPDQIGDIPAAGAHPDDATVTIFQEWSDAVNKGLIQPSQKMLAFLKAGSATGITVENPPPEGTVVPAAVVTNAAAVLAPPPQQPPPPVVAAQPPPVVAAQPPPATGAQALAQAAAAGAGPTVATNTEAQAAARLNWERLMGRAPLGTAAAPNAATAQTDRQIYEAGAAFGQQRLGALATYAKSDTVQTAVAHLRAKNVPVVLTEKGNTYYDDVHNVLYAKYEDLYTDGATFAHEDVHVAGTLGGRPDVPLRLKATDPNVTEGAFVDSAGEEELHAFHDRIQARLQLQANGQTAKGLPGDDLYKTAYDKAAADLKASNPLATDAQVAAAADAAGMARMKTAYKTGELRHSTGVTYAQAAAAAYHAQRGN